MTSLASKPGISGATVLSIPQNWDPAWFRSFVNNQLSNADVRNAIAGTNITITGNITGRATISATAGITTPLNLPAPASGTYTLQVTGAANQYAQVIQANTTTGESFGLVINGSTGPSDYALLVKNAFGTQTLLAIQDTQGSLGNNTAAGGVPMLTWNNVGNFTIATPNSGAPLTIDANPNDYSLKWSDGTHIGGLYLGTSAGDAIQIGSVSNHGVGLFVNGGTPALQIATSGQVTIVPATSASSLVVEGNSGVQTAQISGSSVTSNSYGLFINAGTNASDTALNVYNVSQSHQLFGVYGDGSFNLGYNGSNTTFYWAASNGYSFFDGVAAKLTLAVESSTSALSSGMFLSGGTGAGVITLQCYNAAQTTEVFVVEGDGTVYVPAIGTTASAANAYINNAASNSILRSTSSIRYKSNVRNLEPTATEIVMKLRPVVYNSKAAADDVTKDFLGFIAEEVAEIDPRVVEWVPEILESWVEKDPVTHRRWYRQKKGHVRPESVQYERLTVLLTAAFQKLRAEVDALKASQK